MIKLDSYKNRLRSGDWVRFQSFDKYYVGTITKLHPPCAPNIITFADEIEVTLPDGNRSIRSSNYVIKVTEEEAMLFLLESA